MNKAKLGFAVSFVGLCLALLLIVGLSTSKANDVQAGMGVYGKVIGHEKDILTLQLDLSGMDEPFPDDFGLGLEVVIFPLDDHDPVVTPTASCQNPDTNPNC